MNARHELHISLGERLLRGADKLLPNGKGRHAHSRNKANPRLRRKNEVAKTTESASTNVTEPELVESSPFATKEMLRARLHQLEGQEHVHPTSGAKAEIVFIRHKLGEN
jgi:hypothetical protein